MITTETFGAHLRNALTTYANLIELLKAFQAGEEFAKKYLLEKLDVNELQDNLTHIIDVSKIKEVEDINWRATELFLKNYDGFVMPYFNTCKEWVESLPYDMYLNEYKGRTLCNGKGFEWHNPYDNMYGANPEEVYERLFKQEHYYGLTDNELAELRTTIQYFSLYLNDYFNKMIDMMTELGFSIYKRQGKPGDLIHMYMKRGNISVYFSNLFQVQSFKPNVYDWQWGWHRECPNAKRKQKRIIIDSLPDLQLQDDFGEKTKEWVENYIKKYLLKYI